MTGNSLQPATKLSLIHSHLGVKYTHTRKCPDGKCSGPCISHGEHGHATCTQTRERDPWKPSPLQRLLTLTPSRDSPDLDSSSRGWPRTLNGSSVTVAQLLWSREQVASPVATLPVLLGVWAAAPCWPLLASLSSARQLVF